MAHRFNTMQFVDAKFDFIPGSNTIRKGVKYKDLLPGQELTALDNAENNIGTLVVRSVHIVSYQTALSQYVYSNHLAREMDAAGDFQPKHLASKLEECYGPINADDPVCVIEFEDA